MKLSGNMEGPVVQPIRMYIEAIGKKKMQIIVATFFLLGSFFLSQAVLFDAAVPFFYRFGHLHVLVLENT